MFKRTLLNTALLSALAISQTSFAASQDCTAHFDGTELTIPCIKITGLESTFSGQFKVDQLSPLLLRLSSVNESLIDTPSEQLNGVFIRRGYGEVLAVQDGLFSLYDLNSQSCTLVEYNLPIEFLAFQYPSVLVAEDGSYFNTLEKYQASDIHPYTYTRLAALPTVCLNLTEQPLTDFTVNFEALWHSFNDNYPFFLRKDVDWQEVYDEAKLLLSQVNSNEGLLDLFSKMLRPLNDIHVDIYVDEDEAAVVESYHTIANWLLRAVETYRSEQGLNNLVDAFESQDAFDEFEDFVGDLLENEAGHQQFVQDFVQQAATLIPSYIPDLTCVTETVCSGNINEKVAYLGISTMLGYVEDGDAEQDTAFMQQFLANFIPSLENKAALIIDVRNNLGGYDAISNLIAGHFIEQSQVAYHKKAKFAGGFTNQHSITLEPQTEQPFTKPVYVLIGEQTYSGGEVFALAMKSLPNVTLVGEPTQGGLSDKVTRTLPNGWIFSVPSEIYSDLDGNEFEDIGVPADIESLYWLPADVRVGKDSTIERVLSEL
ncbi:S41 family peptidase [Candidatus Albibeggiatoa sp. nov. NOAA]|uniref:S41 family peptidase n=1 Tax=Candidatus Albibeggiatoa sp. nov. NOAA TaxID=3162724 RepID=UPI003303C6B2|nr:S41 family peptidase [Thiotrichaceae bacterium]